MSLAGEASPYEARSISCLCGEETVSGRADARHGERTDNGEYISLEVSIQQTCASEERAGPRGVKVLDDRHKMGEQERNLPATPSETSRSDRGPTHICSSRMRWYRFAGHLPRRENSYTMFVLSTTDRLSFIRIAMSACTISLRLTSCRPRVFA